MFVRGSTKNSFRGMEAIRDISKPSKTLLRGRDRPDSDRWAPSSNPKPQPFGHDKLLNCTRGGASLTARSEGREAEQNSARPDQAKIWSRRAGLVRWLDFYVVRLSCRTMALPLAKGDTWPSR